MCFSPEQIQALFEQAAREDKPQATQIIEIEVPQLDVINRFAEVFAYLSVQETHYTPHKGKIILIEPAEASSPRENFDDICDIITDIEMISTNLAAEVITQTVNAN